MAKSMTITTTDTASPPPEHFQWNLAQRLLVIDHGAQFSAAGRLDALLDEGTIAAAIFDPLDCLSDAQQARLAILDNCQRINDGLLSTGSSTQISHCHDASFSGSLEPLDASFLPQGLNKGCQVESHSPIETLRLDDVAALPSVDWLILGGHHDHLTLLNHGANKLADTLLFDVQTALSPTHQRQPCLTDICQWMEDHDYQCYRLDSAIMTSHLAPSLVTQKQQASQMLSLNALFVPNQQRLGTMPPARITQLAYLLDSVYGLHDYAYALLNRVAPERGQHYLAARGFLGLYAQQPDHFTLSPDYAPIPWDAAQNRIFLEALQHHSQNREKTTHLMS